jgi:3-keto-5-aminohexanoate cleavage enzyme
MDRDVLLEINAAIRDRCPDLIINNTTGGGPLTTMQDRYDGLRALPELASLNMGPDMSRFVVKARPGSLGHAHEDQVFDECVPYTYGIISRLAALMLEHSIKPELEIYHPGQHWVTQHLIEAGLLEPPYFHQFVMGYQTSSYPTPENVIALVRELPPDSIFSVCGIGQFQLPMTTMAILLGGHLRVGLEDNVYYSRGRKLAGNGEAVERAVRIARELNREVATPAQAREMLGLSQVPRSYDAVNEVVA